MKIVEDTPEKLTMEGYIDGHLMRVTMDKATQELYVSGADLANYLGYKDQEEMLGSDAGLDALNEYRKEHPDKPFMKEI